LCIHAHATNVVKEVVVVFGFSWLVEKVMIEFVGKDIKQIFVKVGRRQHMVREFKRLQRLVLYAGFQLVSTI
jgi:hypothetical protein